MQNPQTQEILLLERPIENADNGMVMVVKPALQSKPYVAIRTLIVKEKPATTRLSTHMPQPIQCPLSVVLGPSSHRRRH